MSEQIPSIMPMDPIPQPSAEPEQAENIQTELPQETQENTIEQTSDVKLEDQQEDVENLDTKVEITPLAPVSNTTESAQSVDYEVSDDDYTNEYGDFSSKKRRVTRQSVAAQNVEVPILDGIYSIEKDRCIWKGSWGMGSKGEINGLKSDFLYTCQVDPETPLNGPVSGKYNGYFWVKLATPTRVDEKDLELNFSQEGAIYRVNGSGSNRLGQFKLTGSYNPVTSALVVTKHYFMVCSNRTEAANREHRRSPRQATPSFLRENVNLPAGLNDDMIMCYKSLKRLMNHKWAGPFLQPVDPEKLNIPDYFDIIKEPMDLGTIQKRIENHEIVTRDDFAFEVRKVFDNACRYNKPTDDVHVMAKTLKELFEKDYVQINRRIYESEPEPSSPVYTNKVPKHSSLPRQRQRSTKTKGTSKSRNKKTGSAVHRGATGENYEDMVQKMLSLQSRMKEMEKQLSEYRSGGDAGNNNDDDTKDDRPLSVDEKKALSSDINRLPGDKLHNIIEIIEANSPLDRQGGEIEIDLDTLPNVTLHRLQEYIKQCTSSENTEQRKRSSGDVTYEQDNIMNPYEDVDSENSANEFF